MGLWCLRVRDDDDEEEVGGRWHCGAVGAETVVQEMCQMGVRCPL